MGGGALLSLSASASCPPRYPTPSATSCQFSHLSSISICSLSTGGTTWTCSLAQSVTGGTPEIWVVTDYDTLGSDYEAWGSYYDGSITQTFCCEASSSAINQIEVFGSSDADNVNLAYNNSGLYSLQPVSGSSLSAYVATGDGQDTIHGSGYDGSTYSEYLCGQGGDDEVAGHPGDDELFGDGCPSTFPPIPQVIYGTDPDGDDVIIGDYGDDTIYGGGGVDTITGGDGDDTIYGEDGHDHIFGNSGEDIIEGGKGDDCLKGGPDADEIDGGDDVDTLIGGTGDDVLVDYSYFSIFWGATTADIAVCGSGSALVDPYTVMYGACSPTTTTTPPSCP